MIRVALTCAIGAGIGACSVWLWPMWPAFVVAAIGGVTGMVIIRIVMLLEQIAEQTKGE